MDDRLQLDLDNGVAVLRFVRPDKLNALDAARVDRMEAICRQLERDDTVKVLIVTGEGRKAFSAGGDIDAWSVQGAAAFAMDWVRLGHLAFDALARLRHPVIAVLNGHALGGGLELAACADIRIAEAHVKIGQPETGLGIIPGWSGTQRAVRRFGSTLVRRMALFSEVFTAAEALDHGLVDKVVPQGEGFAAALEMAGKVKARGALATQLTKMLINAAEGEETERSLEAMAGFVAASSDELQEGLAAFRERRTPRF